jgi:hypothetical protein
MYKITCFAEMDPKSLGEHLKALRFKTIKSGYEWQTNGHIFRIEPFRFQEEHGQYGYRVSFNGGIDGGYYLFDVSLGWLNLDVTAIEYVISISTRSKMDWFQDFKSRKSFKMLDGRGLFDCKGFTVIILDREVHIQKRAYKGKRLKLMDCLKEVDCLQAEITPVEYDLFTVLKETEGGLAG